jgi:two-component system, cell cycle sensor histidine kinase and response regulator CckA
MVQTPQWLEEDRVAKAVQLVGVGTAVAIVLALIHNCMQADWISVVALAIEEGFVLTCLALNRQGAQRAASRVLAVSSVALAATLAVTSQSGVHDVSLLIFPGAIVVSGALLDRRWFVAMCLCCMATVAALYGLELSGLHTRLLSPYVELRHLVDAEVILLVTSLAVGVLVGNLRDSLSQSQSMAAQLADSEARYRTLFESVNDAIFVYDPESLVLVDANRRACELYGYDLEALRGLRVADLCSDEPGVSLLEAARSLAPSDSGGFQLFEWKARDRAGRIFWVEASMRRAALAGHPRLLVSVRDIDERKRAAAERGRLEEQFQQAQKLESVGRLAGGIAHDFNNLLTCVLGNADLALALEDTSETLRDHLSEIQHAGRRATELTGQLLAFSRRQTIAPRSVDVKGLLTSTHRMLDRILGENIQVVTEAAPNLGRIHADPGQVEQILLNLAINARDAMPNGGRLNISARERSIREDFCQTHPTAKAGDFVCIAVEDCGTGMQQEVLGRLFEPFFTTKPKGKGTGLGLAMVFGAVQQNEGFVLVESELGRGTIFSLYFPRHSSEPELESPRAQQFSSPKGSECVLVVEDDDLVRKLTQRMLEGLGYRTVVCRNAEEAVSAASKSQFDLLFTDVILPGTNGRELSLRLVQDYPNLRVLFCSGHSDDVIGQHGIVERGLAFIAKPFTAHQLATKLREVLDEGSG